MGEGFNALAKLLCAGDTPNDLRRETRLMKTETAHANNSNTFSTCGLKDDGQVLRPREWPEKGMARVNWMSSEKALINRDT